MAPKRSALTRFADLFWIFVVASVVLDVYATSTGHESDFWAAAALGGVAAMAFLLGDDS